MRSSVAFSSCSDRSPWSCALERDLTFLFRYDMTGACQSNMHFKSLDVAVPFPHSNPLGTIIIVVRDVWSYIVLNAARMIILLVQASMFLLLYITSLIISTNLKA